MGRYNNHRPTSGSRSVRILRPTRGAWLAALLIAAVVAPVMPTSGAQTVAEAQDGVASSISLSFSNPRGLWSNGTTLWVADADNSKVYAYTMAGDRNAGEDFDTLIDAGNLVPSGLWSDGTTMWITDDPDDREVDRTAYAYDLATKARDDAKDFTICAQVVNPRGLTSDGNVIWIGAAEAGRRLPGSLPPIRTTGGVCGHTARA